MENWRSSDIKMSDNYDHRSATKRLEIGCFSGLSARTNPGGITGAFHICSEVKTTSLGPVKSTKYSTWKSQYHKLSNGKFNSLVVRIRIDHSRTLIEIGDTHKIV